MKETVYADTLRSIESLVEGERDVISVMSTISCELYHAFDYFNWVGFYRRVSPDLLKVGPYQGTHGCLTIAVNQGVCGACVREAAVQIVNDVSREPCHIACSPDTRAEVVMPVFDPQGAVRAVLDIDSNCLDVFDETDSRYLEKICHLIPS